MAKASEATQRLTLRSGSATHPGLVRQNNEDEVFADDEHGIYFVVDGMGGHAAGEEAARIAKERLRGRLEWTAGSPEERVREAITLANNGIFEAAQRNPAQQGMACVLTVALVQGNMATIGHVGDSRLYVIKDGAAAKITQDHSPVGQLEDARELTEEQAMAHPRRNEVYRDVGSVPHAPEDRGFIDIYQIDIQPDSALLLCSDGLTDTVNLAEITSLIQKRAGRPDEVVQRLVNRAIQTGKDNVSVVYAEGPEFAAAMRRKKRTPAARDSDSDITAPNPLPSVQGATSGMSAPKSAMSKWVWPIVWVLLGAALFAGLEHVPGLVHSRLRPQHEAQVIRVTPDSATGPATIKAALEQANPGDSIQLAPGTYPEAVVITKDVTLTGAGARIEPPDTAGPTIGIAVASPANAVLEGLQISGEAGQLIEGIAVDGRATVQHVTITGALRAGIDVRGHGSAKIDYSAIHDNAGAGVLIRGEANCVLRFNNIIGNGYSEVNRKPGVAIDSTGAVQVLGNTFAENAADAIWDIHPPSKQLLVSNYYGLNGRTGRASDVKLIADKPSL